MNIFKEVLKNEVFPALGCTEPIAVAYACSIAAKETGDEIEEINIVVDPGVYKNGLAVNVPNTGGEKGNLIAGVLGALIRRPDLKMEILKDTDHGMITRAKELIQAKKAKISYDESKTDLYIGVSVRTRVDSVRAVIEGGHTNLILLEKNSRLIFQKKTGKDSSPVQEYKSVLKNMKISDLIDLAENIDSEDYNYLRHGIEMNTKISEAGQKMKKVGYYLSDLMTKGYLMDDVFSSCKIMAASASDARMAGLNFPVMSSGGSGNQGIVAILVPYNVGKAFEIEEEKILKSIALSHLINSYIKCFTGDLSPLCGCAIAAGVGASAAIVYQQKGRDMKKITLAVNNLISDLGGMLCDGAKAGCALKVVSSTDSAIRSAYMAINDHGISEVEGFVGKTAEETIYHLSKISEIGMAKVDDIMLGIMKEKNL
ncbi:L-serine ammonia-lyase, iron-sulfur-dependent, subunit alpha [Desulfococcaceae bacterium HSG8]|nr:L-serine ammonia-lyase, iron-sulfur-dependent, subunit alpha [Desulfococcaceae bacterium HSG8]